MSVEGLRIWPWGGDEAGTHDSVQGGGFKPVLRPQSPVPPQKGERGGLGPGLTRPLSLGRERERERESERLADRGTRMSSSCHSLLLRRDRVTLPVFGGLAP